MCSALCSLDTAVQTATEQRIVLLRENVLCGTNAEGHIAFWNAWQIAAAHHIEDNFLAFSIAESEGQCAGATGCQHLCGGRSLHLLGLSQQIQQIFQRGGAFIFLLQINLSLCSIGGEEETFRRFQLRRCILDRKIDRYDLVTAVVQDTDLSDTIQGQLGIADLLEGVAVDRFASQLILIVFSGQFDTAAVGAQIGQRLFRIASLGEQKIDGDGILAIGIVDQHWPDIGVGLFSLMGEHAFTCRIV